jgi:uncharacterized OsmC-like protein
MTTPTQPAASGVPMTAEGAPQFKVNLQHGPSGTRITTEAPKDNGGTGSSFSPTDLVGAALASCAITTMALVASREGLPWGEASASVEKRMTGAPRRIAELVLEIRMPKGLNAEQRAKLEEIARFCPVARSLHPDVKVPLTFVYAD